MGEKIKKIRKTTIHGRFQRAAKRGRIHRFAKWVEAFYGVSFRSTYGKLRRNRVKIWEGKGITRCMDEYGFHGTPSELWDKTVRNKLCDFMETQQMSRMTTWRKFSTGNFSELEMKGIGATYRYWRENVDSKKERL